ncbi:hypothetical protein SAMN05660209_03812 [Geodermatophilus africanus]|uniref:Uncharacterized protein n=1 Tax=Geodermatophilus africanus TaxID=1137993 RepID=A0A1H3N173_9ACTN|nr:hypothetical protein [Geodermatophilus africanus]SDY82642.1 hypothetical protein SAMN05660209_03812 [Geodermatophilus africanus]
MSPGPWIEQRGRRHRVYWRNGVAGLPARSYLQFYGRDAAEQFVGMAGLGLLGLHTACQVLDTDDPLEATALLQAALAERGLVETALLECCLPNDTRVSGTTVDPQKRHRGPSRRRLGPRGSRAPAARRRGQASRWRSTTAPATSGTTA